MSVTSFKIKVYEEYRKADMLKAIEPPPPPPLPPFNGMSQFAIQLKISFRLITLKKGNSNRKSPRCKGHT